VNDLSARVLDLDYEKEATFIAQRPSQGVLQRGLADLQMGGGRT
jgi:hypothetical protein